MLPSQVGENGEKEREALTWVDRPSNSSVIHRRHPSPKRRLSDWEKQQ